MDALWNLDASYYALRSVETWVVAMFEKPTSAKAGHIVLFNDCN